VVRVEVAEAKETQVLAVVFDGDHVFEVLMCKILQYYWDVVRVQEQLGEVLEFQDV
jgi:hypothetical protein